MALHLSDAARRNLHDFRHGLASGSGRFILSSRPSFVVFLGGKDSPDVSSPTLVGGSPDLLRLNGSVACKGCHWRPMVIPVATEAGVPPRGSLLYFCKTCRRQKIKTMSWTILTQLSQRNIPHKLLIFKKAFDIICV